MEKLRGSENYVAWKFSLKMTLILEDLWDSVSQSTNDTYKDKKALARICLSLETQLFQYVREAKSAKEAWDNLAAVFEDRGLCRRVLLLRQLHRIDYKDFRNMHDYINAAMTLVSQLSDIGRTIEDGEVAEILLSGLPSEYDVLVSNMETACISSSLSSELVRTRLLQEELRKNGNNEHKAIENAHFARKKLVCNFCGKTGHVRNRCFKLRRQKKEETAKACTITESAFFVATAEDFVVDSGCSNHMIKNKDILRSFKTQKNKVCMANNDHLDSLGTGKFVIPSCNIEIEAMLVPKLAMNLLSVSKLTKGGFSLFFNAKGCHIYKDGDCRITGRVVGHASDINGVYKLDSSPTPGNVSQPSVCSSVLLKKGVQEKQSALSVSAEVWHKRLGHMSYGGMCALRQNNVLMFQDNKEHKLPACVACLEGKQVSKSFPSGEARRAAGRLELIHSDICGPMPVRSWGGARYMLTFTDDFSRKSWVYLLQEKNQVYSLFIDFKNLVEKQCGAHIKCLRTDGGGEYCNDRLRSYLRSQGIIHQVTVPYCPQQNGVSERLNRTLLEKARCMLQESGLSREFWGEAVMAALYIKNRSPTVALGGLIPEQVWTGQNIDLGHLRVFGCIAFSLIPEHKRSKLDAKSKQYIFVGYSDTTKGYRLTDPKNPKRIIHSKHVEFLEGKFLKDSGNVPCESCKHNNFTEHQVIISNQFNNSNDTVIDNKINNIPNDMNNLQNNNCDNLNCIESNCDIRCSENESNQSDLSSNNITILSGADSEYCTGDEDAGTSAASSNLEDLNGGSVEPAPPSLRGEVESSSGLQVPGSVTDSSRPVRSTRGKPPLRYGDYDLSLLVHNEVEPLSYNDAMLSLDKEEWRLAMEREYNSLLKNNVWKLVDRPCDKNVIKCKWVYKLKRDDSGKDSYKARLVARGFSQQQGVDYSDTFSPVVRHTTLRTLFALANEFNWDISHFDVETAFLNSNLNEHIFMEQPEGFDTDKNKVCFLLKSIYGLKQASRMWNQKVHQLLCNNGFIQSKCEPCVYVCKSNGKSTIIALYVDDFYVFGNCSVTKENLLKLLQQEFIVKDLGALKTCLGMNVCRDRSKSTLTLNQKSYIEKLLLRFGMEKCKPVTTPMMLNCKLDRPKGNCLDENKYPYRELIGSLMYLAVCTRPDIAFVCSQLSQFCCGFEMSHWLAAKRVLRYLAGTLDYGLCFYKTHHLDITAYTDADWGNDIVDRKSYTGFVVKLGNCTINWEARKQKCVALSSTEAEYLAISDVCKDLCFVQNFLNEIISRVPKITLYNDNQSAQKLLESKEYSHKRTKHIDLRYHYIKDLIQSGFATVKYLSTQEMIADVLTKPLSSMKHKYFINEINVKNVELLTI